ncbi:MAG: PilN domain-containing protein [Gemmatimonadetes bacterium]|nr:PilN domain-containing protein [Gemmatimonadota bacterium]MBT8402427.1 PilN domain-containing protein [Gemmatimonadota bacterium]NNF37636.1 PilN domain-containing protein [Gemmatimonadota bacterium]
MLQVNLIPDGRSKKRRGGGFSLSLPTFSRMPDRWVLGALVAVLGAVGVGAGLWYSSEGRRAEVEVALERAVQDSSRFADLISRTSALTARRDSIFEKVGIIQEIDRDRFVWPHILDEVARSLPEYTWLTEVVQVQEVPLKVQVSGRAGNIFAITVFMNQLQASPFFSQVTFLSSEESIENAGTVESQAVQEFQLELEYEPVPLEELETVPLFGTDTSMSEDVGTEPAPEEN